MTAPTAAPEQAGLFEDFIDIFISPSKVYARRANAGFFAPMMIIAVICAVLAYVNFGSMTAVMDAEMARNMKTAMESNPNLTEDQFNAMRGPMEIGFKYGAIVVLPIMMLIIGTLVWLVGKIFGSAMSWGTGMVIAVYATTPRIVEGITVAIQALVLDASAWNSRFSASLGVGRFLDPEGPQGMMNFLGRVDVFTLWVTLLIGVGFVHAGKMEKNKAIGAAALMWLIGGIAALPALLSGK